MANDKCSEENLIKYRLLLEKIKKEKQAMSLAEIKRADEDKKRIAQELLQKKQQEIREKQLEAKQAAAAAERKAILKKRHDMFAMSLSLEVQAGKLTQQQADQILLQFMNSGENCGPGTECLRLHQKDLLYNAWQKAQKRADKKESKALVKEKQYYNFIENAPSNKPDYGYRKDVLKPKFTQEIQPYRDRKLDLINEMKVANDIIINTLYSQIISRERMDEFNFRLDRKNNSLLSNMDQHFADTFTSARKVWYNYVNLDSAQWWFTRLQICFWIFLIIFAIFTIYLNYKQLLNIDFWIICLLFGFLPLYLPFISDFLFTYLFSKDNILAIGNIVLIIILASLTFLIFHGFNNMNNPNSFSKSLFKSHVSSISNKGQEIASQTMEKANEIQDKAKELQNKAKENIKSKQNELKNKVEDIKKETQSNFNNITKDLSNKVSKAI